MANPMGRPSLTYYIAIFLLVASVVIGSVLVLLLVSRPAAQTIRFDVGAAVPQECPADAGAPVCYAFDVTNGGEALGTASCTAGAAEGNEALFLTGEPTVIFQLEAGEKRILIVTVSPVAGSDVVRTASVTCEPA